MPPLIFLCPRCLPQAQFLNLLLCRCFQLSYLEKHPEEAQEDSAGSAPRRNPSLLNHGFPLSVSALVSFRRAPFRGLLPGLKVWFPNVRVIACLHLTSPPCDAAMRNTDGEQEVIFYSSSRLTNSHYADVLSCLWLLQSIQQRNQREFLLHPQGCLFSKGNNGRM